jgi:hypothetical protein
MTDFAITAVVCANGLGHMRRTGQVLSRLLRRDPGINVTLVCEEWQVAEARRDSAEASVVESDRVRVVTGIMAPGVTWQESPDPFADGRLHEWLGRLAARDEIAQADLVLSDNLGSVLALRPDAVMLGSFLWSGILGDAYPESTEVRCFVEHERGLLTVHRPAMLCVGEFAMADVQRYTRAVELPLMVRTGARDHESAKAPGNPPEIAVLVGSTGILDSGVAPIARAIRNALGCTVRLPGRHLDTASDHGGSAPFGFSDEEFTRLDLVICRPGMGTVQDCVAFGAPMVLIHEDRNSEVQHNALVAQRLGIAIDAGHGATPEAIVGAVRSALAPGHQQRMRAAMSRLRVDGYDRAADWLLEHIESLRNGQRRVVSRTGSR